MEIAPSSSVARISKRWTGVRWSVITARLRRIVPDARRRVPVQRGSGAELPRSLVPLAQTQATTAADGSFSLSSLASGSEYALYIQSETWHLVGADKPFYAVAVPAPSAGVTLRARSVAYARLRLIDEQSGGPISSHFMFTHAATGDGTEVRVRFLDGRSDSTQAPARLIAVASTYTNVFLLQVIDAPADTTSIKVSIEVPEYRAASSLGA